MSHVPRLQLFHGVVWIKNWDIKFPCKRWRKAREIDGKKGNKAFDVAMQVVHLLEIRNRLNTQVCRRNYRGHYKNTRKVLWRRCFVCPV